MKFIYFFIVLIMTSNIESTYKIAKNTKKHTSGAVFPDDWHLQALLTQNITKSHEGRALALSADGNTLAVGAPGYIWHGKGGVAQIYVRSGVIWTHQATVLQYTTDDSSQEGYSVSLSADGNMLAIGDPEWDKGATQIYIRSGTIWTHQATLTQNGRDFSYEGWSIALTPDGSTLAAGSMIAKGQHRFTQDQATPGHIKQP